jgi:hypothetical protein
MPDLDLDTILGWRGRTVRDRKDEEIGKIGDLYLDEATDRPAYAGVRTGLFGRHESILPLDGLVERDGDLIAPYDAELVRDAPAVDPDEALDESEQERLARHYRAPDGAGGAGGGAAIGGDTGAVDRAGDGEGAIAQGRDRDRAVDANGDADREVDRDGDPERDVDRDRDDDGAMIRSEEEVVTGTTEMRPTERVRLRKVLVTDQVTRTVPVRREEIRLETDPPPEGDVEHVEDVRRDAQ